MFTRLMVTAPGPEMHDSAFAKMKRHLPQVGPLDDLVYIFWMMSQFFVVTSLLPNKANVCKLHDNGS